MNDKETWTSQKNHVNICDQWKFVFLARNLVQFDKIKFLKLSVKAP